MIVAGEASSDLHGAHLLKALRKQGFEGRIAGVGGEHMRTEKFETIIPAESFSIAGLTEVILALPRMLSYLLRLTKWARKHRPAVAVLTDLPDFNLRLAKRLKKIGIPVIYYISPQLWAWRTKRVEQVKKYIDKMLVILPFEESFYHEHGVEVEFVGHPLMEEIRNAPNQEEARKQLQLDAPETRIIALLPGSRRKEVAKHLPTMLQSITMLRQRFPELEVVIPVASAVLRNLVEQIVKREGVQVKLLPGNSNVALRAADAAIVCSGTSTLQTALLNRPMVIIYKVSTLSYWLLKKLVKVSHIGLVNLVAGRRLVPELLQDDLTPNNLYSEMAEILTNQKLQKSLESEFHQLRASLETNDVSAKVANHILEFLNKSKTPAQQPPLQP